MTEDCQSPATGSHELSLTRLIAATPEQCFRGDRQCRQQPSIR